MDGASQNSDVGERYLKVIQAWMLANVQNRGYERFDDLHVDRIDPDWKPREKWIDAGIRAFRLAIDLRDREQLSFTVALAYSLAALKPPHRGTDFRTREELESQLGSSPPSLYLFARGDEPWTKSSIRKADAIADSLVVKDLPPDFLGVAIGKRWYYIEFRQAKFDEWSRNVFVEG
jgi:hypothetical protein